MNLKLVRIYKFCLVWKFLLVSVPKSAPQNCCPFFFWLLLVLKVEVPFQNKVKGFEEDFLYPIFVEQDDLPVDDTISTVGNLSTSHIAVVLRWNDTTKTKKEKIVSMLSTIHIGQLIDSGKEHFRTKETIYKPDVIVDYNTTMGGVDLLSRVVIPYSSQRRGVKWYRKLAELFLDISMYNSFLVYKKISVDDVIDTHLKFKLDVIEELITRHHHGATPPNPGPKAGPNLLRLVERHFHALIPATIKKQNAQKRCHRCTKRNIRRDTRYYCPDCNVPLCFEPCFKIYHTKKDFIKNYDDEGNEETEDSSQASQDEN